MEKEHPGERAGRAADHGQCEQHGFRCPEDVLLSLMLVRAEGDERDEVHQDKIGDQE